MRLRNKRNVRRSGGLLMSGTALSVAGLLLTVAHGTAVAAATHGTPGSAAPASTAPARQTASSSSSAMTVARPLTGKAGLVPAQGSGFSCVVDVQRSKTVIAYTPLQIYHTARSFSYHWLVFPYSVTHARIVNHRNWTFQVQLCATGGGNTWNVWDQYFDGLGMTLKYTAPFMIGWNWAVKVDNGTASASLNFEVNAGIVKIGGTDTVSSYGAHSGNPGVNTNISWPSSWNKYDANRVNTYYQSAHTFWWQGTSAFEGNVGHALYEDVTSKTVPFSYGADVTISAQCHRLVGNCVPFS